MASSGSSRLNSRAQSAGVSGFREIGNIDSCADQNARAGLPLHAMTGRRRPRKCQQEAEDSSSTESCAAWCFFGLFLFEIGPGTFAKGIRHIWGWDFKQ